MRLSELKPGECAVVVKVTGHGAFRKRIMEMGFVRGKTVSVVLDAPLRDPVKYKVMDYEVSLRRSEAAMIEVVFENGSVERSAEGSFGTEIHERRCADNHSVANSHVINIALVGNPNSGKTSLFNAASGGREHVGNYGGVTVDAKKGTFSHRGYKFTIHDLPGTYSLSAYTPEELYVRRHLLEESPDVVVNVVAASNLERNLFLTTELIDMDCTTVMALNMYDELQASGATLDHRKLSQLLGIPVVPTVSRSGRGLAKLFDTIIEIFEDRGPAKQVQINHVPVLENAIRELTAQVQPENTLRHHFPARYIALKLLEQDREMNTFLSGGDDYPRLSAVRDRLAADVVKDMGEDIETVITNDKYGFITGALQETFDPGHKQEIETTKIIDSFVTHKLFGFPIFLLFMWLMFEATFSLGQYPMEWIENCIAWLGATLHSIMPDGMLKDLLADGIIGGVGGVIVFLPNILILYLFISFMEDSGYMARAAFIMDKIMHRIGLHGKSFIPLIMGFGCNVPAIMATRTIESRSSRLITILVNPFISCSARLPVYLLLVGAFFPGHGGMVMFLLYIFGVAVAAVTARLLRRFLFRKDDTPFVMELPPYRMPTLRSTLRHMWEKAVQYLRKMGGIILVASIIVWFLSYFPRFQENRTEVAATSFNVADGPTGVAGKLAAVMHIEDHAPNEDYPLQLTGPLPDEYEGYMRQKDSYIGRIGTFISPVMEPLGMDWRSSVALLTGMAAKEVVVSTMGVLYSVSDADENTAVLQQRLTRPDPVTGEPPMSTAAALAFLVFTLLYFPCIAALVAIARESGSWKWAVFSFVYNTILAWLLAFVVYRISLLVL